MTLLTQLNAVDSPMTTGEVARLVGVTSQTVTRWANAGLLTSVRTPGGHRRFRPADVHTMLKEGQS